MDSSVRLAIGVYLNFLGIVFVRPHSKVVVVFLRGIPLWKQAVGSLWTQGATGPPQPPFACACFLNRLFSLQFGCFVVPLTRPRYE
uniref:Secreted protein n=1 Tax=Steinernema glaseri TaxID=37863 RepID=A0A1I7Z050_9BILA